MGMEKGFSLPNRTFQISSRSLSRGIFVPVTKAFCSAGPKRSNVVIDRSPPPLSRDVWFARTSPSSFVAKVPLTGSLSVDDSRFRESGKRSGSM